MGVIQEEGAFMWRDERSQLPGDIVIDHVAGAEQAGTIVVVASAPLIETTSQCSQTATRQTTGRMPINATQSEADSCLKTHLKPFPLSNSVLAAFTKSPLASKRILVQLYEPSYKMDLTNTMLSC